MGILTKNRRFSKTIFFKSYLLMVNLVYCIPDAKRGYYAFIIVVVRVRRDFLLATYSPHSFRISFIFGRWLDMVEDSPPYLFDRLYV